MGQTKKQSLGRWGESQAALFLIRQGYEIVSQNYRHKKAKGELDIIAWHDKYHFGRTLCFIEIKTRSSCMGSAERATGNKKISSILQTAQWYCLEREIDIDTTPIQFEQVSVYLNEKNKKITFKKYSIPID